MLERLSERELLDAGMAGFTQVALASDIPGVARNLDPDLINPWGFSETNQGQFRISANGAGNAPLLTAGGREIGQAVLLQPPLGSPPGTTTTPNGNVANTTSDFVISDDGKSAPASVIFSTEDGTIIGFNPKVDSKEGILVAQASDGAVYKLLAEASNSKGNFLFATDFHNGKIDVFFGSSSMAASRAPAPRACGASPSATATATPILIRSTSPPASITRMTASSARSRRCRRKSRRTPRHPWRHRRSRRRLSPS
jgi:uncharacterized protein (TIGR03118 family)